MILAEKTKQTGVDSLNERECLNLGKVNSILPGVSTSREIFLYAFAIDQ